MIRSLSDSEWPVRSAAVFHLEEKVGETFDYLYQAPESLRTESVQRWILWWEDKYKQAWPGE
jgi:hypothetical protein